jgi:hypothetical protein
MVGIDISEDRPTPGAYDRLGGGDKRVSRQHHLGACRKSGGPEGKLDGVGPVCDPDTVRGSAERGVLAFESGHLFSLDKRRVV